MSRKQAPLPLAIVIPSYNRPERLRRCLAAINQLDYPRSAFSVIVVDDGSPQSLAAITEEHSDSLRIRCVRQKNQGPGAARNHGLRLAEEPWVVFTDDDCCPDPQWLRCIAEGAERAPGAALGGRVVNGLNGNVFAESSQLLIDYLYDYYKARPMAPAFFTSNNLAFPTEELRRVGGFDPSFPLAAGEDRELCDRWRRGGGVLHFVPEALVLHEHDLKAASFWRQHFNYGRGAFQFHQARAKHSAGVVSVEPWEFYRDMLGYPMKRHPGLRGAVASLLILLSQVANVGGYFFERSRQTLTS